MIPPFTFILGAVNNMFGNTVCRGWAKAYWLSERSMSSHREMWSGSEYFCSEASVVLAFVMQCTVMCSWPLAHSGDNSSFPEGLPEPRSAVSILLVLGNKALCLSHLPKDSYLVFVKKKKKKITQAMKRCLSFENTPKSLECVFAICLLSEWLQFAFHHSKIHFLSMVLSRLTLSHSHACQVIVRVSWEQQEVERKWEAWCFPISRSAFALGTTVGKGVS